MDLALATIGARCGGGNRSAVCALGTRGQHAVAGRRHVAKRGRPGAGTGCGGPHRTNRSGRAVRRAARSQGLAALGAGAGSHGTRADRWRLARREAGRSGARSSGTNQEIDPGAGRAAGTAPGRKPRPRDCPRPIALLKQMELQAKSIPEKTLTDRKQALAQLTSWCARPKTPAGVVQRQRHEATAQPNEERASRPGRQAGQRAEKGRLSEGDAGARQAQAATDRRQVERTGKAGPGQADGAVAAIAGEKDRGPQEGRGRARRKSTPSAEAGNVGRADKLQQQLDKLAQKAADGQAGQDGPAAQAGRRSR